MFICTYCGEHADCYDHTIPIAYRHNIAGYIIKSQVGDGVMRAMEMLHGYWRVVELIA